MNKIETYRRRLAALDVLLDVLGVLAAFALAEVVRFQVLDGVRNGPVSVTVFRWCLTGVYALALVFVFYLEGLYHHGRGGQIAQDVAKIAVSSLLGLFVYIAVFALLRTPDYSRVAQALFGVFTVVLLSGKHAAIDLAVRRDRRIGLNQRRTVVVGNGRLAREYMQASVQDREQGITVDGYLSREKKADMGEPLGSYEEIGAVLDRLRPDEVVIALEAHENDLMPMVLAACERSGVRTSIIPYYNDYLPRRPQIEVLGDCKLINIRSIPLDDLFLAALKRGFDIAGSLALLIVSGPVMLLVALGVKLSSPGPVLFRQERVGRNKRNFVMLKFRSMRTDIDHAGWTTEDDPRKTRFGSFIRKYSLDELPQFWNVLRGDMSLVGPRPELPNFVEQFSQEIPLYLVRHQVRPGITGWAQVNGYRGDTSIARRIEHDIWYIENWTWLLDLKILWMTAFGGFINGEKKAREGQEDQEAKEGQEDQKAGAGGEGPESGGEGTTG